MIYIIGLLFGPIGAIVLGLGAAAAVSNKGIIGEKSKKIGEKIYNYSAATKNYTVEKIMSVNNEIIYKYNQYNNKNENNITYTPIENNNINKNNV